jgi:S-formylglutathione hydrolase FrmB
MSNLIDGVLSSSLNQREIPFRLILPREYASSKKHYPVLYLLHGLFGSFENWTDLTDLATSASDLEIIIVMPDGGDGWYTDSSEKYESYLTDELLPEIDRNYRSIADRRHRAIAGNSMGGYGAFKFALKYPELFAFACSFSGAFHAPALNGPSSGGSGDILGPSITRVFGERDSDIRNANDLKKLAAVTSDCLPYFYFDCGLDDDFISTNRDLAKTFDELGIPHEFHEFDGGHDWDYWGRQIRHLLKFAIEKFQPMEKD